MSVARKYRPTLPLLYTRHNQTGKIRWRFLPNDFAKLTLYAEKNKFYAKNNVQLRDL